MSVISPCSVPQCFPGGRRCGFSALRGAHNTSLENGRYGDKPLSALRTALRFFTSLTGAIVSPRESLTPQKHPHQACDLIRPKPRGSAGPGGGRGGVGALLRGGTESLFIKEKGGESHRLNLLTVC